MLIKEDREKPAPPNQKFDWDAYNCDVRMGISAMEQVKKRERGEYYIVETKG